MNVGKRLDTAFNRLFQLFGCTGLREIDDGLHVGEHVFASMLGFPGQSGDFLLASLLFGDVPGDLRCADDLAVGISDRGNGQGHVNQAAVFALPDSLEMVDALTTPDTRQNDALFVMAVHRNNDGDGLAHGLFGRIAEDALRAPVPARYDAIEVLAHDGVVA